MAVRAAEQDAGAAVLCDVLSQTARRAVPLLR